LNARREGVQSFVDPSITSKFWFSRGSGRLEAGKSVRWDWEMYGFSVEAKVNGERRCRTD